MALQAKTIWQLIMLVGAIVSGSQALAQSQQKTPYWASIEEPEARMRTGPSTEFPVKWIYKRQNLPLKVVAVHSVWRKVEDPDGDQGWMHVRLLSPKRTAVITGGGIGIDRQRHYLAAEQVRAAEDFDLIRALVAGLGIRDGQRG